MNFKNNMNRENFILYKREIATCRKILNKQKRLGWAKLCSSFNHKIPPKKIWSIIKAFKNKNIKVKLVDNHVISQKSENAIGKLCPPSCVSFPEYSFEVMKMRDLCNPDVQSWMEDPISVRELKLALDSARLKSSPGLD